MHLSLSRCSQAACFSAALLLAGELSFAADSANWPQWRGPHDTGSTTAGKYPTKLDESQMLWKVALPGKGCSTPIVWNQRVYLTAPIDGEDALLALDWSGNKLWHTALGQETPGRHRNGSGSNPSPVTDGKIIFVSFKSGNIGAVDVSGKRLWQTNLTEKFGPVKLNWDHGTSPALTEKNVIIARLHQGESWVAAFDKQTGEMRWKTPRNYETPRECDNGYTTPMVIRHEGRESVLIWGGQHLTIHDASDGKLLWSCGNFNPADIPNVPAISNPVIAGGVVLVSFGRADRGTGGMHGIKLGGKGDVTATNRIWQRTDTGAFVPTPAVYQGKVYLLSDRGQVDCLDPATGRTLWSEALPRGAQNYYASPMIADGILYAAREDGTVFVVSVKDGFKLLGENKISDRLIASFVPVADRLFVRGEKHLYCLAAR